MGLMLLVGVVGACRTQPVGGKAFHFPGSALAVPNETEWVYGLDPVSGKMVHTQRLPVPTYSLHCFVLARTAKQLHAHAEFLPTEAPLTEAGYRKRLQAVLARSPRSFSSDADRIQFPGFASAQDFSAAFPDLIRQSSGGAWRSYLQRGNWRMILPFTRRGQQHEADRIAAAVRSGSAPVVHISEFPRLNINHALLFYEVETMDQGLRFKAYDPNAPLVPVTLTYTSKRGFLMPAVPYFSGGAVHVYEVYCSWSR